MREVTPGKQALFRTANERMAAWEERHVQSRSEYYYCECADPNCRENVVLGKFEYERCRADPGHFVIVPGHEVPTMETVLERHEGWAIIEAAGIPVDRFSDNAAPGAPGHRT